MAAVSFCSVVELTIGVLCFLEKRLVGHCLPRGCVAVLLLQVEPESIPGALQLLQLWAQGVSDGMEARREKRAKLWAHFMDDFEPWETEELRDDPAALAAWKEDIFEDRLKETRDSQVLNVIAVAGLDATTNDKMFWSRRSGLAAAVLEEDGSGLRYMDMQGLMREVVGRSAVVLSGMFDVSRVWSWTEAALRVLGCGGKDVDGAALGIRLLVPWLMVVVWYSCSWPGGSRGGHS